MEKDIYVELIIRAIRNGSEWQGSIVKLPRQDKDTYTYIEAKLSDLLKTIGAEVQQLRNSDKPAVKPTGR